MIEVETIYYNTDKTTAHYFKFICHICNDTISSCSISIMPQQVYFSHSEWKNAVETSECPTVVIYNHLEKYLNITHPSTTTNIHTDITTYLNSTKFIEDIKKQIVKEL